MSENTTTPPDWIAAKRVAKDGIKMAKLIFKALNAAPKKLRHKKAFDGAGIGEKTSTQPDWAAVKRVAKDSIQMANLIIKAANSAPQKRQQCARKK